MSLNILVIVLVLMSSVTDSLIVIDSQNNVLVYNHMTAEFGPQSYNVNASLMVSDPIDFCVPRYPASTYILY